MDVINIQNWTNNQVIHWFQGLDETLRKYEPHLREAEIIGEQLLSLTHDDLYNLQINPIGHQELILDAVSLLQQLDCGLDSETLQSRALCLKCRCRGLRSSITNRRREAEEYEYDGGVSLQRGATNQLLHLASDALDEGKQLVLWLDRAPFNAKSEFRIIRDKLVALCYELSVTMQQSVFACVIEDAALNICIEMENSADSIVQSSDALTIQPVSLERIHLRNVNPNEGLGLFIKATFEGHHVVTGTRVDSVASRAKKITSGDEVIAVNGKTVVGWTLGSLVAALKEQPHEVSLLMKKRPQVLSSSSSNLLAAFQRNENERSKLLRAAAPVKKINLHSAKSDIKSTSIIEHLSIGSSTGTWSSQKSRDMAEDTSSARTSLCTSSSEISDRRRSGSPAESGNVSSFSHHRSSSFNSDHQVTPRDSHRKQPPPRNCVIPVISTPKLPEEPTSPIDILKIPPPPSEPYTPKTDHLTVEVLYGENSNRSTSPNSVLDIEHKRRYTVIGGSTVDERWYEEFISQVNKSKLAPSSSQASQDQISSAEEVFTSTPPIRFTSSAALHQPDSRNFLQDQRRIRNVARPVSMPPNYYSPIRRPDRLINQSPNTAALESANRNYRAASKHVQQTNPILSRGGGLARDRPSPFQPTSRQYLPSHSDYKPARRYFHFNENNNNNSNSSIDSQSDNKLLNGKSKRSVSSHTSMKNPPEPPPRSSSIPKPGFRSSGEIHQRIVHSHQSSLPLPLSHPNMEENTKQNSLPSQKPTIPTKPNFRTQPDKRTLCSSTPHLQPKESMTVSEAVKKFSTVESKSTPPIDEAQSHTHVSNHVDRFEPPKTGLNHTEIVPTSRPVPKPRTKLRKISDGDILSKASAEIKIPVPSERYRRKSAGCDPQKTKMQMILDSLEPHNIANDEEQNGHVISRDRSWRSLTSPRSSPTIVRVSYTAAIENMDQYTSSASNEVLVSGDVPQPNDSYEVKLISGVPIRLRKSLTRLTSNKSRSSPEKNRPTRSVTSQKDTVSYQMKGERRVSCRDLGLGDCQGWLWKKKSGVSSSGSGPLSTKWAKRWVIIKDGAIYCYRNNSVDEGQKAECYISLPGYQVAPAPECKRKFAFHITHVMRKTFFFAAERQLDMSRWMNKMGLAAIEYKFEGKSTGESSNAKDNDYYSESDASTESDDKLSSSPRAQSCSVSPAKRHDTPDVFVSSVNDQFEPLKLARPVTMEPSTSPRSNGDLRNRSQSESIKHLTDDKNMDSLDMKVPHASLGSEDVLTSLPPSPRKKPNVTSEQRRHRGNNVKRIGGEKSRSLDSLLFGTHASYNTSEAARYLKAKELAAKKAETWKAYQMSLASPAITVGRAKKERSASVTSDREKKKENRLSLSMLFSDLFNNVDENKSVPSASNSSSVNETFPQMRPSMSSPSLSSATVVNSSISNSRRDVAGRPKVSLERNISATDASKENISSQPRTQEYVRRKPRVKRDESLKNWCTTIKQAEVDLRGINRRATLKRKMTILSRDPHINERMLRKRALERELKAKELELAYFNKLLNKNNITSSDLHAWINQHPSLVAELGTIRRLSKKKNRPRVDDGTNEIYPPDGDSDNFDTSTENTVQNSISHTNNNEKSNSVTEIEANVNNNNSKVGARLSRPRSSAIGESDFNYPSMLQYNNNNGSAEAATSLNNSPSNKTSMIGNPRSKKSHRRKVTPNSRFSTKQRPDPPYLETDL